MSTNSKRLSPEEVNRIGEKIYIEKYEDTLEREHPNEYLVLEVETGKIFVGKQLTELVVKANQKYPNKLFYVTRIGHIGEPLFSRI